MTTLNAEDLFREPIDSLPHPLLRNWKTRLDQPKTQATLEIFRPEAEFGKGQAEICLHFSQNGTPLPVETEIWDDDLNAGLIQLGVHAVDRQNEAVRCSLGLRAALRKPERRFGDGYFNAVFVELLKESDLAQHQELADVLNQAYALEANKESQNYTICREMIADAIGGRARELTGPLKYEKEDAKQIMIDALALYLDERFSVSRRRRLGLL